MIPEVLAIAHEATTNPRGAAAKARALVLKTALSREEDDVVRWVLQSWWETETDSQELLRYVHDLTTRDGDDSASQRREILLAVLCARAVVHLTGRWRGEVESLLSQVEARALGDRGVHLGAAKRRLLEIAGVDDCAYFYAVYAALYASRGEALGARSMAGFALLYRRGRWETSPHEPILYDFLLLIRAAVPWVPV